MHEDTQVYVRIHGLRKADDTQGYLRIHEDILGYMRIHRVT